MDKNCKTGGIRADASRFLSLHKREKCFLMYYIKKVNENKSKKVLQKGRRRL